MTEAQPSRDERGECHRNERRRPEIEATEDHRAQQKWSDCCKAERGPDVCRATSECAQDDGHGSKRRRTAQPHERLEGASEACRHFLVATGFRKPREGEDRQRAGRVLDPEVAVGNLSVSDRIAVALIYGRIDQLLLLVEADMQQSPRDDEERDRREGRGHHGTLRRRLRPARGHSRAEHRRRTGRTTGCRARTSA